MIKKNNLILQQLKKSQEKVTNISLSDHTPSFDFDIEDILYSICSEFFIERVNFKNIMFKNHLSELEKFRSFAPNLSLIHI